QELPGVNVVMTDEDPIGAARDAVRSEAHLRPDEGVIVLDCDLWFQSASYNAMVEAALRDEDPIAGGLLTFPSDSPKYSYAKIDENGFVTETAEKRVISDRAITGAYFFGRASEFTEMAWYFLRNPLPEGMNEYYLSHLYNIMLERGGRIRTAMVDEFDSFGTPEELEAYEASRAA
ncbi:MAG TPA: hypothetical protein VLF67_02195, partial [Candidatus Saccharimonas sp.]|nr:hypothetical protein [Candidatus Saccharimonas sp.]